MHKKDGCIRGQPIKCGSTIRLLHNTSGKLLHSHLHVSPLSSQQEVSGYNEPGDSNDDWEVVCEEGETEWRREQPIGLKHTETNTFLTSEAGYRFGHPIPGHLEVACAYFDEWDPHGSNSWQAQVNSIFMA